MTCVSSNFRASETLVTFRKEHDHAIVFPRAERVEPRGSEPEQRQAARELRQAQDGSPAEVRARDDDRSREAGSVQGPAEEFKMAGNIIFIDVH